MAVEAVRVDGQRLSSSFRTLSVHEARALLLYGIERRRPVQLVVGRAGCGKSRLLSALSRTAVDGAELVLVRALPATIEATTALLAERFGVPGIAGEAPLELLVRVATVLADRRRAGRLVALLVDDAHLVSPATLLDLRLLVGTDADGGALLPIVMAGRPELAATLEASSLASLNLGVATHIELRRPLPVAVEAGEGLPAVVDPPDTERSRRGWWWVMAAAMAGAVVATGPVGSRWPLAPVEPTSAAVPPAVLTIPIPADVLRVPADAPPSLPDAIPDLAAPQPADRLTAAGVRDLVGALSTALTRRDLVGLERLLASDARQNGVRGRGPILESYAYRFARLDAPLSIGAPKRITLHDGNAVAEVPFDTAYRDAAGTAGTVTGTLRLRIGRHDGRPVVDSLDWAFAGETP